MPLTQKPAGQASNRQTSPVSGITHKYWDYNNVSRSRINLYTEKSLSSIQCSSKFNRSICYAVLQAKETCSIHFGQAGVNIQKRAKTIANYFASLFFFSTHNLPLNLVSNAVVSLLMSSSSWKEHQQVLWVLPKMQDLSIIPPTLFLNQYFIYWLPIIGLISNFFQN